MTDIIEIDKPETMTFPVIDIKLGCMMLKNRLKQEYPNITDDDLICSDGKKDMMLKALQTKLCKSAPELRDIIRNL